MQTTVPPCNSEALKHQQASLDDATDTTTTQVKKIEYDEIPNEYKASKQLPYRKFESDAFMGLIRQQVRLVEALGSTSTSSGLTILELGCGEGHYSRKIMQEFNPSHLTSIDLSSQMVALAKKQDPNNTIEYKVQDCMDLPILNAKGRGSSYDLCVAAYILCYATTEAELVHFLTSIHKNLRPGSSFITITDNIFDDPKKYGEHTKPCGLVKILQPSSSSNSIGDSDRKDGAAMTLVFIQKQEEKVSSEENEYSELCRATDWWLSPSVYDRAFQAVGFNSWEWISLPASGVACFDDNPPIILLKATK